MRLDAILGPATGAERCSPRRERPKLILEIRTYRLVPGTSGEFVRLMTEESLPLLADFGIRVVTCGTSLVSEDGHDEAYLIRAFDSLDQHHAQEEAFYSSTAWRDGPRVAVLACIESYHTVVLPAEMAWPGLSLA